VNLKSTKAHVSYLNAFALYWGIGISRESSYEMPDWIERNVQAATLKISQKLYFQLLFS